MTFIHVDIDQVTHTCPADSRPHPIDTRRTIVATVDGGPCRNPVTIHSGDTTTVIACGRHQPHHRQCPACHITVIERSITTTHAARQHPYPGTAA